MKLLAEKLPRTLKKDEICKQKVNQRHIKQLNKKTINKIWNQVNNVLIAKLIKMIHFQ